MAADRRQRGFSLVELIVVVVIIGLLAGGAGLLILQPIEAYDAQVRRQQLVDQGEMALRQIARDVRRALPNSIRITTVGTGWAVEMVPTMDGARYRDQNETGLGSADDILEIGNPGGDAAFNLLGRLNNPANANYRVVIYNTSSVILYADAAANGSSGVITPSTSTIAVGTPPDYANEDRITLSANFSFDLASPGQRVFFVDQPISYVCDPATSRIMRHTGYGFVDPQPTSPPGGTPVITQLSGCNMTYTPGSAQRGGILSVEINIDDSGESINLLHQIHVANVP